MLYKTKKIKSVVRKIKIKKLKIYYNTTKKLDWVKIGDMKEQTISTLIVNWQKMGDSVPQGGPQ